MQGEEVSNKLAAVSAAQEGGQHGSTDHERLHPLDAGIIKVQQRKSSPCTVAPLHICCLACRPIKSFLSATIWSTFTLQQTLDAGIIKVQQGKSSPCTVAPLHICCLACRPMKSFLSATIWSIFTLQPTLAAGVTRNPAT